jgi:hypothetical protein
LCLTGVARRVHDETISIVVNMPYII